MLKYLKYIAIVALVASQSTFAQQASYTLQNPETGTNKQYVARDFVKLTPGFSYSATQAGQTFNAKIDAGLLFPPTEGTYKFADGTTSHMPIKHVPVTMLGNVVGSIPGIADVTPSGAATYNIPIEVPAGINGMQPTVSISYSSQAGFGALGMGWDISGISSISRTSQSFYYDEIEGKVETNSVGFNNKDRIVLDGKRLIHLNDFEHLNEGAVYATETEDYSRVTIKQSSLTNSIYFEMITKDGKIYEYGNSNNSVLKSTFKRLDPRIISWRLNRITDVFGNYIEYEYSGNYLSKIKYTGTTQTQPTKEIRFVYESYANLPEIEMVAESQFIRDFKIENDKRLSEIITTSDNFELKRYNFKYLYTKLTEISLKSSNSESVNSTTIKWADHIDYVEGSALIMENYSDMQDVTLSEAEGSSIYFADINGDGRQDRIELWEGVGDENGHIRVYLFNTLSNSYPLIHTYEKTFAANNRGVKYQLLTMDINNNGCLDIVFFHMMSVFTIMYQNGEFVFNSFNFDGNKINHINQGWFLYTSHGYIAKVTNLNNDIYPDIFVLPLGKFDQSNYFQYYKISNTYYGSKDGFVQGPTFDLSVEDMRQGNAKIEIGDFNADNIGDIMVFGAHLNFNDAYVKNYNGITIFHEPSWSTQVKDARYHLTCDYNNDGLTDMVIQDEDYNWKLIKNTGGYKSFEIYNINLHNVSDGTGKGKEREFAINIDYNGDGYMDIVIADETWVKGPNWSWFNSEYVHSHTTFYFYKNVRGVRFVLEKTFNSNQRIPKTAPTVVDINNDGVQDLVLINSSKVYAYTMQNSNKRNLVKGITNGFGQTQEFEYSYYTNYNQATVELPIRNLKAPVIIATTLKDIDGSATNYTFEDAKIHVRGKGLLGFKKVTSTNQIKNTKTISTFDYDKKFYVMNLDSQVILTFDNKEISSLTQNVEIMIVDSIRNRFIPIVSKVKAVDLLRNISTITENLEYDKYWNVTEIKTSVGQNSTTIKTNFKSRVENQVQYLPDTIITTQLNETKIPHIRKTLYHYNQFGNVIKEIQDPTADNELITEYLEFDSWGHPTKVKVSANGQSRESTTEYTSNGYFIYKKTNVLKETFVYNWDNNTQLLKEEIDRFGRVAVKYSYNKWGQTEETQYRDGNRTSEVLRWAEKNNTFGAMYYKYSVVSGGSPAYTYYNYLGQKIAIQTYGLNNKPVYEFIEYYNNGRVWRVSEPTFSTSEKVWATTSTYDEYGRIKTIETNQGTTTYTYDKKSVKAETKVGSKITNSIETVINDAAQKIYTIVNDKKVTYTYYSSGLVKTSTPEGGQAVTMEYDLQGNRIKIIDPNAGIVESQYDGFGKLIWEKQRIHDNANAVLTKNNYNPNNGKLESVERNVGSTNAEITTYTYDESVNFKSRINSIEIYGKHKQSFKYDDFSRVIERIEEIKGKKFSSKTEYDALGRVVKEIYPSGYYITNKYDNYSNLIEIIDSRGKLIWKAVAENARGQLTEIFRGGKTVYYGFDSRGLATTIKTTDSIIDLEYYFDDKLNLEFRIDHKTRQKEMFKYDNLNRLEEWNIYQNEILKKNNNIVYDSNGNIIRKSDLGDFELNYGEPITDSNTPPSINRNPGINAITSITGVPANFPTANLNVSYTDFKKIHKLNEGANEYIITYGVDEQRRISEFKVNEDLQLTRYYLGNYEEEVLKNGSIRKIHYLSGAIYVENNNANDSLYFVYTDFQGSVIAVTDEIGNVKRRYAYDPWGARRNNEDWTQKDNCIDLIFNRGYTGHEHLDAFGIINMNGRVYDPLTAMFFSPDPYISSPDDWLSYNRYSYVLNNPFRYTDPSGNVPWFIVPTFSYSYYGGLSVGLTGGVGIPGGASVGGSISYNFKHQNFSATINGSFSGMYAYAGYDSRAGFIAGAGFGFQSLMVGNFGISSNMLGASINYSQNGGVSLSMFGFNMTQNGMQFDPSISTSYTFNGEFKANRRSETQSNDASTTQALQLVREAVADQLAAMIKKPELASPTREITHEVTTPIRETTVIAMKNEVMVREIVASQPNNQKNIILDIDKTVAWLNKNAHAKSQGYCAKYVRMALEAGGLSTAGRPNSAKDYVSFLPTLGFSELNTTNYIPEAGDIAVFQSFTGRSTHKHGHIQMYNGTKWISDFVQKDFWPGSDYRNYQPKFSIFKLK